MAVALTAMVSGACMMSWDATGSDDEGLKHARKIRGTVSGLSGTGLVLTNRAKEDVVLEPGATSFEFLIGDGESYAVAVKSAPRSPVQDCFVANSVGTVLEADVTDVVVVCTTVGFTVSAEISGLVGSLALVNGSETLLVRDNGVHAFRPVPQGNAYAVAVLTQPATQHCTVAGAAAGVMATSDLVVPVRCIDSVLEGFDRSSSLPLGWTVSLATPSTTSWHVSREGAASAPHCARVLGTPTVLDTALVSPPISIAGDHPQLRFDHSFDAELGYDGGVLEIRINGGPFTDIVAAGGSFSTAGYNGTIQAGGFSAPPLGGRSAWTGSSGGYVTTVVNLPPLTGKTIALRWRWGNDNNNSAANSGWRIDNVAVYR